MLSLRSLPLVPALFVGAFSVALISSAPASTLLWEGDNDALWDTAGNWSSAAKPTAADDLIFPASVPASGGTITLGSAENALSLTFRSSFTLSGGDLLLAGAGRVTVASGATTTVNSLLTGANGLTLAASNGLNDADAQAGGGALVLDGNNTYTGATLIEAGILRVAHGGALGSTAGGTTVAAGASLEITGVAIGEESLILNGTGAGGAGALISTGTSSLAGSVTLASAATLGIDGALTLSGALTGGFALTKNGTATLTLTGTEVNSTGLLTVNRGVVELNKTGVDAIGSSGARMVSSDLGAAVIRLLASNQIADDAPLSFSSSGGQVALFDLNGFSETVGAINMATTTVGTSTISTGASGVLTLTADLLLNNNRGATGNTGREILITSNGSYGTIGSGGTLDLGGGDRVIRVVGANFANANATIETNIRNGAIVKEGSHALLLRGVNTYAGGTTINDGQIVVFNNSALGTGSIQVGSAGELAIGNVSFNHDVTMLGGTLSGAGGNASDYAGTLTLMNDSAVVLRDYATLLGTLLLARDLTISGRLAGSGGFTVSAPAGATLRLSGDSTGYTGVVTVGEFAAVEISNPAALGDGGAIGSGQETVVLSGGSLRLTNNITVAGEGLSIAGNGFDNGAFASDGALRNLGGINEWAGTVSLAASATIQSDGGHLTLSAPVSVAGSGADLTVRGMGDLTIAGSVNLGGGAFNKLDSGTLTFTSNLTAIPVTNFAGGTLGFTGPQSFGAATIPAGLAFRFNSDPGAGVSITAPVDARVIAGYAADQALLDRITTNSAGVLALGVDSANPLDFSTHPALSLGAAGADSVTFSGTLVPGASGYQLGGGPGQLVVNSTLGGAHALSINGEVRLGAQNTFTGPVSVNSGARLAILDNTNLGSEGNIVTLNGGTLQIHEAGPNAGALYFQFGNPINSVGTDQSRKLVVGANGGTIDVPAAAGGGNGVAITGLNSLQGAAGVTLTKSGLGVMYVVDSNDYAGNLIIGTNGNQVDVRGRGSLPNVSSVTINVGGYLNIDNQNRIGSRQFDSVANDDRFNDAATITMLGGRLMYTARGVALSGTSSREVFGTVDIGAGQSEIRAERGGGAGADLVITNLTHVYGGGTVRFTAGGTALGNSGDSGRIRVLGLNGSGSELATGAFLGGWALYNSSDFATYIQSALGSTGGIVRYGYGSGAPAYATTIASGNVTNLSASLTLAAGDNSTLALRLSQGAAQTISFANAVDTLFIESGGILSDGQNFARAIGSSSVRGNLTAGVMGATAPQELFLHNNANTLTIYANVVDNPGGGSVRLVKDLDGAVTLDSNLNTYSGGTLVLRGTLSVNRTGGLGSGSVVVKNATMNLGAFGASSGLNVPVGEPVVRVTDTGALVLTSSSTSSGGYTAAGDRFYISAGSTIYGNSPGAGIGLNSLTRVDTITGGGQIVLEPDAIVQHNTTNAPGQGSGILTIGNLGNRADLYFGVGNTTGANSTLTIGAGTPWKGISSDRSTRTWEQGTIYANSDFYLQGLTRDNGQAILVLGSPNAGTYSIINSAGKPINALVQGTVQLNDDDGPVLPSDLTFVVQPGSLLQPNRTGSLGAGTQTAKVVVQAGGTLDPGSYVSINTSGAGYGLQSSPLLSPLNGSVTVNAGGRFLINDASGIGSAAPGSYLIKKDGVLELGNAAAFKGSGDVALGGTNDTGLIMPGQFVFEPGAIVRFTANDIVGLSQFVLGAANGGSLVYELVNSNRRLTAQINPLIEPSLGVPVAAPEDFTIGAGGILTNDSLDRQMDGNGGGRLILRNGSTLAATTQTILTINVSTEVEAGATITIGVPGSIDGNYKLGVVSFNESNNLKLGAGSRLVLTEGTTLALSNVNVFPDDGNIDLPLPVTDIISGVGTTPGTGTSLWLNSGGTETIAKLTGVGRVQTNQSVTLEVGSGLGVGDDFTFAGEFSNAGGQNVNVSKIGDGTFFITGGASGNTSTGLLSAYQGRITLKDEGSVHFAANLGAGGTIVLDNSGTALNDRLSGGNIGVSGGDFLLIGNDTVPVTETVGQLNNQQFPGGIGHFNVQPGAAKTTLTFNTIQEYQNGDRRGTFVFRGAGLSGLPGSYDLDGVYAANAVNQVNGLISANNANLTSRMTVNQTGNLITGAIGTPVVAFRPDIFGSLDPNSVYGDRFATQDDSGTGFRLLADSEYASSIVPDNSTGPVNVKLTASAAVEGDTRINALTFGSGDTTLTIAGTHPTANWPSRLYFYVPAIVVEAGGNATIEGDGSGAYIDRGNGSPWYFYTFGDLTLNVGVIGSNGFIKSGSGTLTFGPGALSANQSAQGGAYGGSFWGGTHTINGGKVIMGDSTTFLRAQNNNNAPHLVVNDGILDLNGFSQIYNRLDSSSPLPNTGGTITSATPAVLANYGGGSFSGHITGAVSYLKSYNSTETFTSANTYTGTTMVDGGTLMLVDSGTLENTSAITLKYGSLVLDDTHHNSAANRIRSDIAISSLGGTFDVRGRMEENTVVNVADFQLMGRDTTIRVDTAAFGSTTLNIGNITRGDDASTLLFTTGYGTFGYPGVGQQDLHVNFNLNGGLPALTNGIMGGWAVVNSSFASYYSGGGVGEVGDIASGFPATVSNTITTWDATTNASFSGNPSAALGTASLNSLRLLDNGSNPTVSFATGGSLTLTSGGLITNQNRTVTIGTTSSRGTLTSGSPYLYAWIYQNTTVMNSVIADNGTTPVGLIKLAAGTLQLTGANTYTGDTYVYQGNLTLNTSGANGTTTVAVPGDLYVVGGDVVESSARQISESSHITIGGGAALTLRGGTAVSFPSFTLLNEGGSTSNNRPVITASVTGGSISLTEPNAITVVDNALFSTPTLSVNLGTINFAGAAGVPQVISVDGNPTEPISFVFNPNVGTVPAGVVGGGLVKTGDGMMVLGGTAANQFGVAAAGPDTEVFNIQEGIVRIDHANALGNIHAITTVQPGGVLLGRNITSATAGITGSIVLKAGSTLGATEGSVTLGNATTDPAALSKLTIGGNIDLYTTDFFLPVTQSYTFTINSLLTGSGAINVIAPSGPGATGILRLGNNITGTAPGANDYTGTITLNVNAQLLSQPTGGATTGSELSGASIVLNGGELRIRDDGTTSNGMLDYGNDVLLQASSSINVDRIGTSANTNNRIQLGTLTLAGGVLDLTVVGGNSYDVGFAVIDGAGTLRKEGTGELYIDSFGANSSRDFVVMGPQGINNQASQGLNFSSEVNNVHSLTVLGNYSPLAGKTVNVDTLTVGRETSVTNGLNGIMNGTRTGAVSVPNGAILNVDTLQNDGVIGSTGTGGAEIVATSIKGTGYYQTVGQQLTLTGRLNDPSGIFRVAGGTTANDIVTLNTTQNAVIGKVEVLGGTLRITNESATVTPLGTNISVIGYPASTPGANSQAVAAVGGTLFFDTTTSGNFIQHVGDIESSGTIRAGGTGVTEISGSIHGSAVSYVPGLLEGRVATNALDTSVNRIGNPGNFGIKLEPRMAQTNLVTGNALTGWENNVMWVYTGEFYDADGLFSFAENVDDRVLISIDGVNVLINNSSAQMTSTAYSVGQSGNTANIAGANSGTPTLNFGMGAKGDGWHTIEIRLVNGTGGAGATVNNGFGANYGLGLNAEGPTALDGALYSRPIDPGDGSLFRTAVGGKGNILVDPGAILRVQSFDLMANVLINGGSTIESALELTGTGTSRADALTVANIGTLVIPTGHTVETQKLTVGVLGEFLKTGPGLLSVQGTGGVAFASTSLVSIDSGVLRISGTSAPTDSPDAQVYVDGGDAALLVNGSLAGHVNVGQIWGGGRLGGNGSVGFVDVSQGTLSPGDPDLTGGLGTLATGTLTLNSSAVLELQLGGTGNGLYDQLNVTGQVNLDGELRLTLTAGFVPSFGDVFTVILNDDTDAISAVGTGFWNAIYDPAFSDIYPTVFDTSGNPYLLSFTGGNGLFDVPGGNDMALMAVVPEPRTAATLLLAGVTLLGFGCRRNSVR